MTGVYFITDGALVKIGKGNDPMRRVKALQTGNGNNLKLVMFLPFQDDADAFMTERVLHYFYRSKRVRGEWFDVLNDIDPMAIAALYGDKDCLIEKDNGLASVFDGTKYSIDKIRKSLGIKRPPFKRYEAKTKEEAIERWRGVMERTEERICAS